jgi:hypothetical protein
MIHPTSAAGNAHALPRVREGRCPGGADVACHGARGGASPHSIDQSQRRETWTMPIVVSDRADATATSFAVEEIEEEQLDCYWRLYTVETEDDRLADVGLEPRGGVLGRDKVCKAGGSLFVVLSRRGGVPARGVSDGDGALPWT